MPRKKKDFWNKEYEKAKHLALSDTHSEDLEKFTRFLVRKTGKSLLNVTRKAVDVGCGNGRNIIFLAQRFGMHGLGYDLSATAIAEAKENAGEMPPACGSMYSKDSLEFLVQDLREPIPLPDDSVTIGLDMMASHVLKRAERERLRDEFVRVLKPGGWLFFKTFLLDGDKNAAELLREYPGPEEGMYVHPSIKVAEYVWREEEIHPFFEPHFTVHKIERSHKHIDKYGRAWKRRTMSVYLERTP